MILFSTLPHRRTTPRWPAGTMAKEPHETMKRINRTTKTKIVWGFGVLKSEVSNDLPGIVRLLSNGMIGRPQPTFSFFWKKALSKSMGMGRITVELFSVPISVKV
jgi:hypothetical protein